MRGLGTLMFVSQHVSLQYVHVQAIYLVCAWYMLAFFFGVGLPRASQMIKQTRIYNYIYMHCK